jgi:DNA polymerase III subunit beta
VTAEPATAAAGLRATVAQNDLLAALRYVLRAVEGHPTVPVLAGVLLRAEHGGLTLTTTNYDAWATTWVSAPGARGTVLASARLLAKCVALLPKGGDVTLSPDTGTRRLLVQGFTADERVTYTLPSLPVEDYPSEPVLTGLTTAAVLGRDDLTALALVAQAAGRDDTLPVLNTVRLGHYAKGETGPLTAAATDRYRLAEYAAPGATWTGAPMLVPRATVTTLTQAYRKALRVTVQRTPGAGSDAWVHVSDGVRTWVARGEDGEFPKVGALWPKGAMATVTADSARLSTAVRRAAVVAPRNAPVRLCCTQGDVLEVRAGYAGDEARRDDDAAAVATCPAMVDGEALTVGYSPEYLRHGLRMFAKREVTISVTAPTRPSVLSAASVPGLRYLLMPVRLDG